MKSKQKMLLLVKDIVKKNGCPNNIEVYSKIYKKSKLTRDKELRYKNEIFICYKNGKKFKVNEVFYFEHCKMVIDEIEKFITTLNTEDE